MSEQAPGILTGLPDLPDLVLDALTQMRSQGQWQEKQLREFAHLRQTLRDGRRRDLLALCGIGGGIALAASGLCISGGIALAAVTLIWRLAAD